MIRFLISIGFSILMVKADSQKPVIDTSVLGKWTYPYSGKISPDGKYVCYAYEQTQKIMSVFSNWNIELNKTNVEFTLNNKEALLQAPGDSLFLLQLGTHDKTYVGQSAGGEALLNGPTHQWLVYKRSEDKTNRVHIRDLQTNKELIKEIPAGYIFNSGSETILYIKEETGSKSLYQLSLLNGQEQLIYTGSAINLSNISFDQQGRRLCFFVQDENKLVSIWYYETGMPSAEKKLSSELKGIDTGYVLAPAPPVFNKEGTKLFFYLVERERPVLSPPKDIPKLSIWSYSDIVLQNEQALGFSNGISKKTSTAALNLRSGKTYQLFEEGERFEEMSEDVSKRSRSLLIRKGLSSGEDFWWQESAFSSVYLLNTDNGTKTLIKAKIPFGHIWSRSLELKLSADERFVLWYDPFEKAWFSYEIATGVTRNISANIPAIWEDKTNQAFGTALRCPVGIAGWTDKDQFVILYDNHDLWMVDPLGKEQAVNLTNGYGKTHDIQLRFSEDSHTPIHPGDKILLTGFNEQTKENGFFNITLGKSVDPVLLTMGPYFYRKPDKAANANAWIVMWESATEAPNYFVSKDLKQFKAISDIQPQKKYNWLTTELIHWKALDGSPNDGILYKPENFDSTKKYPVIFNYYELRSQELYHFLEPKLTNSQINIPWFVSRGYVVCVADTHMPSVPVMGDDRAVNSVYPAAQYLSTLPWVDAKHLGIEGHSYGGAQTIALITNTNIFAAASEGAGPSDQLSMALQLMPYVYTGLLTAEVSQGARNKTVWEDRAYYTKENFILKADQVTTPLLMMHNKDDNSVPWEQAQELYIALRRLGKRVWWLQYDGEGHWVGNEQNAKDYTIRMTQFFDHYLKGALPPKWMTEGIPAREKGINLKYELDSSGKEPEEQKVLFKGKIQLVGDAIAPSGH